MCVANFRRVIGLKFWTHPLMYRVYQKLLAVVERSYTKNFWGYKIGTMHIHGSRQTQTFRGTVAGWHLNQRQSAQQSFLNTAKHHNNKKLSQKINKCIYLFPKMHSRGNESIPNTAGMSSKPLINSETAQLLRKCDRVAQLCN
jgi:hypothetical protein